MLENISKELSYVRVTTLRKGDPVLVESHPSNWRCVGVGNSAAVFQLKNAPHLSIKVYADKYASIAQDEAAIYQQLGDSPFFPHFYGYGENYICIEYRPGCNINDCLVQGIYIPEQVIYDVDEAIAYARSRNLNPTDIHSKNILVHEGRGFLIDVSDYGQTEECKRWDNLKQAYYNYYIKLYRPGFTVPSWVLEIIRKWYKANEAKDNLEDFAETIVRLFFK
ncbi:serine/threonine protein kinase [Bacillota bacterium LX-D]|nr:serine/threonine protein kinase [Bacillota bacterium LX-D]